MLVDTDVLIWFMRGNKKAALLLDNLDHFSISAVTFMELIQGLRNKQELRVMKEYFSERGVVIEHLTASISNRAVFLVEQYYLSHSMKIADALIASTALEKGLILVTANDKHFKVVKDLEISRFRPTLQ